MKKRSIISLILFVVVILGYFSFNFFYNIVSYSNFQNSSKILQHISKRKPYLIQQGILLKEAIFRNSSNWMGESKRLYLTFNIVNEDDNSTGFEGYTDLILDNEEELLDFIIMDSNQFESYNALASALDSDKFCFHSISIFD